MDVAVVGAGPAGIATAVALVEAGRALGQGPPRLVVLDAARFPRDKPCGGGLTGRSLEALERLGLALRVRHRAVGWAEMRYGDQRRVVPLPRPARISCRRELDADLVEQARARGVFVIEGARCTGLGPDAAGQGLALTTTAGELRARFVVGADGAVGQSRRLLAGRLSRPPAAPLRLLHATGCPPKGPLVPARQRDEADGAGEVGMVFDFTPLAGGLRGYAWWFDAPDGGNVGVMHVPRQSLGGRPAALELGGQPLRAFGRAAGSGERPLHGWSAPAYQPALPLWLPIGKGGLCLVGDAAGIDPLFGEGIAVALWDGLLAGRLLGEALAGRRPDLGGYAGERRRAPMGRSLAVRRQIARLLYLAPTLGLRVALDRAVLALMADEISGTGPIADRKLGALWAAVRALMVPKLRRSRRSAWPAPESRPHR